MLTSLARGIPIPVSATANATRPSSAVPILNVTPPFSVNLNALDSRFLSTC